MAKTRQRFQSILGLDQTGASTRGGLEAKPFPLAMIHHDRLHFANSKGRPLSLKSLTRQEILNALLELKIYGRDLSKTMIAVDSVLGLPKAHTPQKTKDLFSLFQQASQFSIKDKHYGRDVAEAFFSRFLNSKDGPISARRCEVLAGANSVFQFRPYQKNISTGTFRIWKDLGRSSEPWFQIFPFDEPAPHLQDGPWIFEGYPSLLWKQIFGLNTRNDEALIQILSSSEWTQKLQIPVNDLHLLRLNPDLADSVVLAVGAWALQRDNQLWFAGKSPSLEGWIMGLQERPLKESRDLESEDCRSSLSC
jgi:hypothetical protein